MNSSNSKKQWTCFHFYKNFRYIFKKMYFMRIRINKISRLFKITFSHSNDTNLDSITIRICKSSLVFRDSLHDTYPHLKMILFLKIIPSRPFEISLISICQTVTSSFDRIISINKIISGQSEFSCKLALNISKVVTW